MYVKRYLDPEWNMAVYVKHGGVCQTTSSSSSNDQLQQLVALWRSREARGNHHALREKLAKAEQEASGQRLKAQQEIKAIREQFRAREEPAAPVKATPSPSPSAGAAVAKPPDATKSKDGDLAAKLAARRKWEGGDNGAANGGGGGGGGGGDDDLAAKLAARRKWEGDGDGAPAAQSSSTSSSLKTAGDGTATMSKTAKRVVWRDSCMIEEYELSAQEKQYKRSLLRFLEEEEEEDEDEDEDEEEEWETEEDSETEDEEEWETEEDWGTEDEEEMPLLPPGWQIARDPATGKFYFYNTSTGVVQWGFSLRSSLRDTFSK